MKIDSGIEKRYIEVREFNTEGTGARISVCKDDVVYFSQELKTNKTIIRIQESNFIVDCNYDDFKRCFTVVGVASKTEKTKKKVILMEDEKPNPDTVLPVKSPIVKKTNKKQLKKKIKNGDPA